MSAVLPLCALALRPVLGAALKSLGLEDAAESINGAVAFLTERFTDQSRRLPDALERAGDRSWRCLEIALAGESLWTCLDRAEDRAFRDQVRALLQGEDFPRIKEDFRRRCLAELRAARKAGRLTAKGVPAADLARQTAAFARFAQPAALLDAEWQALAGMGAALHQAGYPTLAKLVAHRPAQAANAPLLAVAVRYFFRREVEADPEQFRGLSLERLDQLSRAQEAGFAALAVALEAQRERLDAALGALGEIRGGVLDIRAEQERQGRKFDDLAGRVLQALAALQLDGRPPRPADSLSIRGDGERRLVKQLLAEYRALPEEQRRGRPALLYGLGKLQMAAGAFEEAQHDFQAVTRLAGDPRAQAEAHFAAYRAALERSRWDEALTELRAAVAGDAGRFAPFPMVDYEAERILGAGGFGVAFLCRRRLTGGRVVVKALNVECLDRDVAAVFQEAAALEQVRHPGVIRLQHCGYADAANRSCPFLVMDYFDGLTLQEHVRRHGALQAKDVLALAIQTAAALRAAHEKGILHRDVKPANLLLRRQGSGWEVRLIDFGLALRTATVRNTTVNGDALGRTLVGGSVAGTLDYAAPEQMGKLQDMPVGKYSDVYGFGRTCCYALFRTPHPGPQHWDLLDRPFKYLLGRCMAEQPKDRPADFDAVVAEVREMAVTQPPPAARHTKSATPAGPAADPGSAGAPPATPMGQLKNPKTSSELNYSLSYADELLRLYDLLQKGVIQEEEFERAKAALLYGHTAESNQPHEEGMARVRIYWPREFFIGDLKIQVRMDGQLVGSGSFQKGFDLVVDAALGTHRIQVTNWSFFKARVHPVAFLQEGAYEVRCKYSRFWGNFSVAPEVVFLGGRRTR